MDYKSGGIVIRQLVNIIIQDVENCLKNTESPEDVLDIHRIYFEKLAVNILNTEINYLCNEIVTLTDSLLVILEDYNYSTPVAIKFQKEYCKTLNEKIIIPFLNL